MEKPTVILPAYLKALSVLLLIIVIIFILILGKSLLIPLFLAGFISALLIPLSNWLESKKFSRISSSLLALLSSLLGILGLLTFIAFQVASFSRDLDNVGEKLNKYLADAEHFLSEKLQIETGIGKGINQDYLISLLQDNSKSVADFIFGTLGSLTSFVLLIVFIFFFLLYRDHLTVFISHVFKHHEPENVKREIKNLRKVIQKYIIGVMKVMAILAVMNTAVLFGLGIKHAVFFGVFAGILNIIPFLGPFLGAILPTIFAFLTKDSLWYPLGVVISFQLIQLIESNFLTPKIVGSNVNLNAFVTFVGLMVGAAIWGIAGMIIIIPALAVLRQIFELSDATKPYAILLGEEELQSEKKEKTDET
ncbi:AI-2E family transporter [Cecembia calidifontis]|jgi:predicted PurR-regulated permease PerM|uniref:Putative PurR-regulated permease PerM n=1 Tax=Cecembia calidifontis TaxID=1187080 RepID=A0A4V2F743_9BACT|nr:AI-2E family transporter [Cecembia calidifontis]RZS98519.1 putative PurR-regulated permease PerM [Cecembia calidifontis]